MLELVAIQSLAKQSKKRRLHAGLTQETLADLALINLATIKRMEHASKDTRLSSVEAIAKVLGCQVWELLKP
jgi:predicted transcriptional regulator